MFQNLINLFVAKKAETFPPSYLVVDWTEPSKEDGVMCDQNKIIIHVHYNRYGRLVQKKYPYSESRLHSLRKTHRIPYYDKTVKDIRHPIYSRVQPSEIKFIREEI